MTKTNYIDDRPIEFKDWVIISLCSLALGFIMAWAGLAVPSQDEPGADAEISPAGEVIYGYGHMEGNHFVPDNSGKINSSL